MGSPNSNIEIAVTLSKQLQNPYMILFLVGLKMFYLYKINLAMGSNPVAISRKGSKTLPGMQIIYISLL